MNWFLMALSAILGGVATWLWSVRKAHRRVPVYEAGAEPKPTAAPVADVGSATGGAPEEATEDVSTEESSVESVEVAGAALAAAEEDSPALPGVDEPMAAVSVPEGPYGPGSAAPGPDGSGPDGWTIKGNAGSGLYHALASPYFTRTKAEVWFETEEAAAAAGFARWDSRRKKKA